MYIRRTLEMARNRPPSYYERGDTGAEFIELIEFTDGRYQVWSNGYYSHRDISPKTLDFDQANRDYAGALERLRQRFGSSVREYGPEDITTYKRALWAPR